MIIIQGHTANRKISRHQNPEALTTQNQIQLTLHDVMVTKSATLNFSLSNVHPNSECIN
jgi:hypothetical protein